MLLKLVRKKLIFFTLICFSRADAEKVIKAVEGATVHLPCHSPPENSQHVTVDWSINTASGHSMCTWNIDMSNSLAFPLKNRLSNLTLTSKPIRLEIKNVQPGDSGKYSCKTTRVIPPPALDNNSSLILQVAGLFLKRLNSTNDSCVHLLCSLDSELANFTWSRGGQMLPHVSTLNDNNSELHLCKPDWSEGDTITCHINYSGTQTQKSIKFSSSEYANSGYQDFPAVFVALLTIFIICISLIWILYYILRYKTQTCHPEPSTSEEGRRDTTQ